MSGFKVLVQVTSVTCRVLLVSAIAISLFSRQAQAEPEEQQAYYLRGKQVEQLYTDYSESLKTEFEKLRVIVANERPDLLPRLQQPERRQYGYQLIPQILSDPDAACADTSLVSQESPFHPKSSRFSWPITESRINKQTRKQVDQLEPGLLPLAEAGAIDNRDPAIESMIETYLELRKSHRSIDEMIQHNWLWQREVSLRKAKYDASTLVHDAIVERTQLRDEFRNADADNIAGTGGLNPLDYVHVEPAGPGLWVVHIPVNTDIEDEMFLQEFKQEVEKRWCINDGEDEYRLQIELRKLPAETLYGGESSDHGLIAVPQKADQISPLEHCRKFPGDAASLTSGSQQTYVQTECLFVGPEDVKASTLVHEFGHLLGFEDEYVRGYRDLSKDGYEIIEIVPNGEDIMANSSQGGIHRRHFLALIAGTHYRAGMKAADRGDHEAAIIAYNKAVEIDADPLNTAYAYNNLGWSLKQLERNEEAMRAFEAAAERRPGWSLPVNNLKLVRKSMDQTD